MPARKTLLRGAQCKRIVTLAAALWFGLGLGLTDATAHDFWIEPLNFRPKTGEKVPLPLRVGQHFKGDTVLYVPESFLRYVVAGADGEQPVTGQRGDDPAGSFTAGTGLHVVGLHTKTFEVTFDSLTEFEKYLVSEGLERNLALAGKRWRLRSGVLEIYSRCAKSFIRAGNTAAAWADHVFGFPLELVAESDPFASGPERTLRVQLLYRGKPLESALIVAFNKTNPSDKVNARTDKNGRVTLALTRSGTWLVTSVHMIPAPLLSRADWESFWASLTFELPH